MVSPASEGCHLSGRERELDAVDELEAAQIQGRSADVLQFDVLEITGFVGARRVRGAGAYMSSVIRSGGVWTRNVAAAGPLQRLPLRARATTRLLALMVMPPE